MEDSFDKLLTPELLAQAEERLRDLPRPLIFFHPKGTNFHNEKNLSDDCIIDTIRQLLSGTTGSVIICDWDDRVPYSNHARVRHLKASWGHLPTIEFVALMHFASLLIGVDSGPIHLANMTSLPSLGVFHHFFPWCVCLPRVSGKSACLTNTPDNCIVERRRVWNSIEYSGSMPTASTIVSTGLRMLSPRYGLPSGQDALIQHLVVDRLQAAPPGQALADRHNTMDVVFRHLGSVADPVIVETGCVRSYEDWSAGYSTYLFGLYLDYRQSGSLVSVDIDGERCQSARHYCRDFSRVEVVASDSVAWLKSNETPIDVLYLDSMDADIPGTEEHGLNEAMAAEARVKHGGLIVIDDTTHDGRNWRGKGGLAVPYLLAIGYEMLASGYQCVLQKGTFGRVYEWKN